MALAPFANYRPVRSYGTAMTAHLGDVMHAQQGNGSPFGWFSDPANQASSHFWISKTGVIEQFIDTALSSWAQMNGNHSYTSTELEGFVTEALTAAQIVAYAKLYRWLAETHGYPYNVVDIVGDRGMAAHFIGGASWGGHPCPGPIRAAQRSDVLKLAQGSITPTPAPVSAYQSKYIIQPCSTGGYWELKRSDGGVANRNGAPFFGSMAGVAQVVSPLVSLTECRRNGRVVGYWITDESGHVYAFGGAPYYTGYAGHPEWQSPNRKMISLVQSAGRNWRSAIRYTQIGEEIGDADYVVDTYDIGPELADK